jgi:hypothetical protein
MTALLGRYTSVRVARDRRTRLTPVLPFTGCIEGAALCKNVLLDTTTIKTHYANGSGLEDP